MRRPVRVLVTSGGSLLGQGIIRSLQASSLPLHISVCDPEPYSAGLYWVDAAYYIPYVRDERYWSTMRQIITQVHPDVVMIGTDHELPIFAQRRAELEKEFGCLVLVSGEDQVLIADDKWLTYKWLKKQGYGYPDSALWDTVTDLVSRVGFPLVVKPRIGQRSMGMKLIYEPEQLLPYLDSGKYQWIFQECVGTPEQEYTAGVLTLGGQTVTIVMRRVLRDGNTYQAFSAPYLELNETIREMAEAFGAYGPANFQFRLTPAGQVKVFEINARFSGTTGIRWHAGYNETEMAIRYLMDGTPLEQPEIQSRIILRHWSETVLRPDEVRF